MTAPQPLDELGATTRRLLFLNYGAPGSPGYRHPVSVYIEGEHALRSDADLLTNPPCQADRLEGVRELVLRIEKYRRGETTPYEATYQRRDVADERPTA